MTAFSFGVFPAARGRGSGAGGAGLLAALLLGGCASLPPASGPGTAPEGESIGYSVGPCFGFCPVYSVTVAPDGAVTFDGERHSAALGHHVRQGAPATYRAMAEALEPYRPANGTEERTQCDAQATDMSDYHISWTAADGSTTLLRHNLGCRSDRNQRLNAVLRALPAQLGIEDWTKSERREAVPGG